MIRARIFQKNLDLNLYIAFYWIDGVSDFLMTSFSMIKGLISFYLTFKKRMFWLVNAAALGHRQVNVRWCPPPLNVEIKIVPTVDTATLSFMV